MNLDGFFIALENCYKFATYLWTDLYQIVCNYLFINYLNIVAKSIRWIILIISFTVHVWLLAKRFHNYPTISCIQYQNTVVIIWPIIIMPLLMQRPAPGLPEKFYKTSFKYVTFSFFAYYINKKKYLCKRIKLYEKRSDCNLQRREQLHST